MKIACTVYRTVAIIKKIYNTLCFDDASQNKKIYIVLPVYRNVIKPFLWMTNRSLLLTNLAPALIKTQKSRALQNYLF